MRELMASANSRQLKSVVDAAKNMFLCLSYSKLATIRNKTLKVIQKLIA